MKTLVLFGSARENGVTKQMVNLLLENLEGESEVIDSYRTKYAPCKDCRYCWHKRGCSIKDGIEEVYAKIDACDVLVLASPMYFHTVTGPLKTLLDRLQVYWASHVRKDYSEKILRNAVFLTVGGAPSFENQFLGGELVYKGLCHDTSSRSMGIIRLPNSDVDSLETRPDIKNEIITLAKKLNENKVERG